MDYGWPDDQTLRAALVLAVRAPSVDNTQPWRFQIDDHVVHLYLDPTRARSPADPDQRDAVVSCGAVLHHLRIALAAAGWSAVVRRLPDAANPNHLAAIELMPHRSTMLESALTDAIRHRQTDHRAFSAAPIPPGYFGLVSERATTLGASVRQAVHGTRVHLIEALCSTATRELGWPTDELTDCAELLVLATPADDRLARLAAGEALSAVLLTATNVGLASCVLTESLELPEVRDRIRGSVLEGRAYPQAVIRIGWASAAAAPLPITPRRALGDVLDQCEATAC
ncbi:Acg family FMN-binding oxidoreductase [Nocardia sp. CA-128927]|uniref:Acg family FMN-binding oxidoreductase n=1 Tax=Nocardia sp. CA-128927 TaxID=3239975 RepID=UPI003D9812BB